MMTIEPGYYDPPAEFGIRIENVYVVREAQPQHTRQQTGTKFLRFEPLTLVPIQTKLIDPTLLTTEEVCSCCPDQLCSLQVAWLDDYHALVKQHVVPELMRQGKAPLAEWLKVQCRPLADAQS